MLALAATFGANYYDINNGNSNPLLTMAYGTEDATMRVCEISYLIEIILL